MGWPANPTKSGPKKQKRGLVSSLDSLNLELFAKVFAKKSKKKTQNRITAATHYCKHRHKVKKLVANRKFTDKEMVGILVGITVQAIFYLGYFLK